MGKVAFLFAGQGAQYPGMGEKLYMTSPAARRIMDALEAVRPGTLEVCFRGEVEALTQTINTQPCLFAVDLACAAAGVEAGLKADCAAGFSLGELCAVSFSGMLTMEETFGLVLRRAEWMQACNESHPGAMLAVLKLTAEQVEAICAQVEGAYPVNYNSPGQTVVACNAALTNDITSRVSQAGGRCLPLKVGGSFHTPVMRPATEGLAKLLADMKVEVPSLPVYANRTAGLYTVAAAKELLSSQASHPVRWQQTIEAMWADGVDTFIEFGPGTTLAGLVKRTVSGAKIASISDPESLEKCLKMLAAGGAEA